MEYKIYSSISQEQNILQKILEKVFITEEFIQCKTSYTLKTNIFEILDKIKILENIFQNMNYFTWINPFPIVIHLNFDTTISHT